MTTNSNAIHDQISNTKEISIMIVDDHKLIRDSLSQILNGKQKYRVVATCSTAAEGIREAGVHKPTILITDINMPGMNGMDAIALIKDASPGTKVIGMSMHSLPSIVKRMIKSGALGYVTKNSPVEELLSAIHEALLGKRYICTEIKDILSEQLALDEVRPKGIRSLSEREVEIIDFIKEGFSSKEIAEQLNIATKTVEVHRYNILKKLKLNNTASLVNYINSNYLQS